MGVDGWGPLVALGVGALTVAWYVVQHLLNRGKVFALKGAVKAKKTQIARSIHDLRERLTRVGGGQLMTPERVRIVNLPFDHLVLELRNDRLTPIEALEAYQARAILAHGSTNCICEFYADSTELALELETVPKDQRGPLFGVPLSVKECIKKKGSDVTFGIAKKIGCPCPRDSPIIRAMKKLGAVPFCSTNLPQTISYDCSNPIYGRTLHPWDSSRTPGGSSGGEACLLSLGGSILGLGTDIGGSLRIPAHFCGIASLKPTFGRICESGRLFDHRVVGIYSNAGIMSQRADGVFSCMKALLEDVDTMAEMDHTVVPIPWRESLFNKTNIRIGWYDFDGYVQATPSCRRAVHNAVDILKDMGYDVVPFQPPHLQEASLMAYMSITGDAFSHLKQFVEHEEVDPSIATNIMLGKIPTSILTSSLLGLFVKRQSQVMAYLQPHQITTPGQMWDLMGDVELLKEKNLEAWRDAGVDIVIAPGFGSPAMLSGYPTKLLHATTYTIVYNVLNLPAGSLTISCTTAEDEAQMDTLPMDDLYYRMVKDGTRDSEGLPLNVQVVGRPWEEELVLRIMKELDEKADARRKYLLPKIMAAVPNVSKCRAF